MPLHLDLDLMLSKVFFVGLVEPSESEVFHPRFLPQLIILEDRVLVYALPHEFLAYLVYWL